MLTSSNIMSSFVSSRSHSPVCRAVCPIFITHFQVINLGTNDLCCGRDANATHVLAYRSALADFTRYVAEKYANFTPPSERLQLFLAAGPMTDNYSPIVAETVTSLAREGMRAHFLDLSLEEGWERGCEGHPSAESHRLMFDKALPQIRGVMKWDEPGKDKPKR